MLKEEHELGDVVIIMSQQLPRTDVFIKQACLLLFPESVAPFLALDPGYFSFYKFSSAFSTQKHLREVTPVSDRKDREEGWSVVCFRSLRRGEGGGSCFYTLVTSEALFLLHLPPQPGFVCSLI